MLLKKAWIPKGHCDMAMEVNRVVQLRAESRSSLGQGPKLWWRGWVAGVFLQDLPHVENIVDSSATQTPS